MKSIYLTIMALLSMGLFFTNHAFGSETEVNTIVVYCTGDVTVCQGNEFQVLNDEGNIARDWRQSDNVLYLNGMDDYVVTVKSLERIYLCSLSDIKTRGTLNGKDLSVNYYSTGDLKMDLSYDNVYVGVFGAGDLDFSGRCNAFFAEYDGTGDLNVTKLDHVLSLANVNGSGDINIGKSPKYIAYYTTMPSNFNYKDTGWGVKCAQGDPLKFKHVDGRWTMGNCDPKEPEVAALLQEAAPFFAAESEQFIKEKAGMHTDGSVVVENLKGLSELLAELGANLGTLADSVDWRSFEEDMEKWGEGMEEWGRQMEKWGEQVERNMERYERNMERYERNMGGREPGQWGNGSPDVVPQPKAKVKAVPPKETKKRSLVFDPHWGGVDAGLNLLLGPGSSANFEGEYAHLETRPLKSWVFNFNIADIGIAFSRSHVAGLYSGVGLGWNNYRFNDPVRLIKDSDPLEIRWIDESEGRVKKSKLGVLYVQMPLMLEVRPTRHFFIAAGVMGGIRIDAWTKVKFEDRKEKIHDDYCLSRYKLDACLRTGSNDFGFFVSYDLMPVFIEPHGPSARNLNVGFSMIF